MAGLRHWIVGDNPETRNHSEACCAGKVVGQSSQTHSHPEARSAVGFEIEPSHQAKMVSTPCAITCCGLQPPPPSIIVLELVLLKTRPKCHLRGR